jgi:phage gpG-like protein
MANNTISVNIQGIPDVNYSLKQLISSVKNPTEPLISSSKEYLDTIKENFDSNGQTFGKPWKPLSEATISIKRALRKEGKSMGVEKPLYRTGLLRRSFNFDLFNNTVSQIFNAQDYAKLHNEGGTAEFNGKTVRIPRRILAAIDDTRREMVAKYFDTWIEKRISELGLGQK